MTVAEMRQKYIDSKCDRAVYMQFYNDARTGAIPFDTWEEFYFMVNNLVYRPDKQAVCERRLVPADPTDIRTKHYWRYTPVK